jgi:hypothetical protein
VHYSKGTMAELQKTHTISFAIDVELSDAVVHEVETRIQEYSSDMDGEMKTQSMEKMDEMNTDAMEKMDGEMNKDHKKKDMMES